MTAVGAARLCVPFSRQRRIWIAASVPLLCHKLKRWWVRHGFASPSAVIPHLMRDPFRCYATSRRSAVPIGHGMDTRSRAVPALVWHDGGGCGAAWYPPLPSSPDLDSGIRPVPVPLAQAVVAMARFRILLRRHPALDAGSIPLWYFTLKRCSSVRSRNGYQIARSACTCLA